MLWALLLRGMNVAEIEKIAGEITEAVLDRRFGKIFPLSESSFAIDFYPHAGCYLFIDHSPRTAAAFLIVRRLKELEQENSRLKRAVAELTLDVQILKDVNSKKW